MADIINNTKGKTRDKPVSDEALARMRRAAEMTDPSLSIAITSGGQAPKGSGGKRTGSTRHDVDHTGHSHTADLVLMRNGKEIRPGQDKALYAKYMENAASLGFTGIGHYDWGIHVGDGSKTAWGPSTTSADLDPEFGAAINRGWGNPLGIEAPVGGQSEMLAQSQIKDPSVKLKDLPPILDEVLAAGQQKYDPKSNPLSGQNTPVVRGNPNNLPPQDRPEASISELTEAAWKSESTTAWAFQSPPETGRDKNWGLTNSRIEADLQQLKDLGGDPKVYSPWLARAHSEENYGAIIADARRDIERQTLLNNAGWVGTALRVGVAMVDPLEVGADFLVAAVAPQFMGVRRSEKLYRALNAGAAGAAGGAAAGAVGWSVNPHQDATDMLYGSVFGLGVGGVVGALGRNPATLREAVCIQRVADEARKAFDGELPGIKMAGSTGAARAQTPKDFLNDEALQFVGGAEIEKSAFLGARVDLYAQMDKSPNTLTRVGAGLVNDGVGKKNGAVNAISASEEQSRFWTGWATSYMKTYRPAFDDFKARHSTGWTDGPKVERDFNDQVYKYIVDRTPGRSERYDPAVIKMGNHQAKLYQEVGQMAQNPFVREGMTGDSVAGFERWQANPHYAMRRWDSDKLVEITKDYVDGTVKDLIVGAIRKANADMEESLIDSLSKGFTRAITNRAHGLEDASVRAMGGDDIESLMEVLTLDGGLSRADADAVLQRFKKEKTADAGDDVRAKHRLLLDETFRFDNVLRGDGTVDEDGLGILDLINTDASSNFLSYARHMSGIVVLSRYRFKDPQTGEVLINGFKSDGEFNHYKELVRRRGAELISSGKMAKEQIEKDIANLDMAYSSIRGRPVSGG
ncbi:hypothetical protein [Pararhizobium sp. DWP1-1-3]|uniref:hypothetical protein n=1 Tax=Pararhizobium sp. DWP1-1-3 TaxID=2804652 RepID=UPI003CEE53EB